MLRGVIVRADVNVFQGVIMKFAVIDLSSTGVSTVIAEGEKATGIFSSVYKDRTNIAVADYFDGRSISKRGIEKIIDALITARSTCKAMGVEECYCISTAGLRNIDNIAEVAERIRMRTGIVINYLDGPTEAYCDFVSNRKYAAYDKVILIDIGGGSVELCDLANDRKDEMICLDRRPSQAHQKVCAQKVGRIQARGQEQVYDGGACRNDKYGDLCRVSGILRNGKAGHRIRLQQV